MQRGTLCSILSLIFFFKQQTAYEILLSLVGSEICISDSCRQRQSASHMCARHPTRSHASIRAQELLERGMNAIRKSMTHLMHKGTLDKAAMDDALSRVRTETTLEARTTAIRSAARCAAAGCLQKCVYVERDSVCVCVCV